MRRLSSDRKSWLDRRVRANYLSLVRQAGWNRQRRSLRQRTPESQRPVVIEAPAKLASEYEDDRQNLVRCLDQITSALEQGRSVQVRFTRTQRLFPGGTLIFVSHILRLAVRYPNRVSVKYPVDAIVEELFQHIGFLGQFGLPSRRTVAADNVKHWHYVTGQKSEVGQLEGLVNQYMNHLPENPNADLYGCLCEAILNVSYHAYPQAEPSPGEPHWWMFAQQKDDRLFVAVYDSGIGIPESLRLRPHFMEQFGQSLHLDSRRFDHKLLARAVQSTRTTTDRPNQGKGLPEMLSFAMGAKNGKFYVLSGHGEFRYDEARGGAKAKHSRFGLRGTLLVWALPLQ